VKDPKGGEQIFKKNDILFIGAKEYYQLINKGPEPLVMFGNRSEPFGIGITRAAEAK
jgi:mannose-6-phosphate isomerase-like protein (cupin superfamily)